MADIKLLSILVLASVLLFGGCKKHNEKKEAADTYTLNITSVNGTVVRDPDSTDYHKGSVVVLTAMPNSNYKFLSWSGSVADSVNPMTVTMDSNIIITANFSFVIDTSALHAPTPTNPLVVSVIDKGATPNDATDDTKAIQAAIDQVAGTGGTVLVPAGTYMINVVTSVNLKSHITFRMEAGAVLQAITTNVKKYAIIDINGVENVNVVGGTVVGERETHTGVGGEWGMGVNVFNSSNIFIEGITAKDCWGDGFYIGGAGEGGSDIMFSGAVADNNRRNGFSVICGKNVIIKNSISKNTKGTNPQDGIDIEPNEGNTVDGVWVLNSMFLNNHLRGVQVYSYSANKTIKNVTIDRNTISGQGYGVLLSTSIATGVRITNNRISASSTGIGLGNLQGVVVTGNTVCAPNPIQEGTGNTVNDNILSTSGCPTYP